MNAPMHNPSQPLPHGRKIKLLLVETLGWYGTIAIILAYILVSFGMLDSKEPAYQILNLSGAVGIISISLHKKAYQPAVLNIIWAAIALVAIVKAVW
ncbi:CBU_0592 family membrane protein [Maridesulfovibrio sp.]|uniref:CBU_0592 family membrane protein n=1 Tax=Maridesulfovibrio sp. TaxID=2795000 RepID=UPI0039EF50FC